MHPTSWSRAGLPAAVLALTLLGSHASHAQTVPAWYLGASLGPTQSTVDGQRIAQTMAATGFPNTSVTDDARDTGYKVFVGYQFGPSFALEGSYFDLGTVGVHARASSSDTLDATLKLRGVGLDALLIAALGPRVSVFAKAGAHYSETRDRLTGTGAVIVRDASPGTTELNPKIGLGLRYALAEGFALRAELERYRINDAVGGRGDTDHLSLGLVYHWGTAHRSLPSTAAGARPASP